VNVSPAARAYNSGAMSSVNSEFVLWAVACIRETGGQLKILGI
jgi:hypothetical protein